MKILVAIESQNRKKSIFKKTLRWVTRTGFDVRVFVRPEELEAYREGARDANYQHYLAIMDYNFISNDQGHDYIFEYAKQNGYDLIIMLPDDLKRFDAPGTSGKEDLMIIEFARCAAVARVKLGEDDTRKDYRLSDKVLMQRV